jgi:hypothetical protein
MKTNTKYWIIAIVAVILAIGSFLLGRYTVKTKIDTDIQYIKGDTIHDTVKISEPASVKPIKLDTVGLIKYCQDHGLYSFLFKVKVDTAYIIKVDTIKLIEDYLAQRTYKQTLFDNDTIGKCDIIAVVQYNELASMNYTYTPIVKQVTNTVTKEKIFEPFLGAGMSTNLEIVGQAGFYIKQHYGVSYEYRNNFKGSDSHAIIVFYKF